jgi:hypothetical protein
MALATISILAEAARVVGADHRVRALDLVGQRLADVVHQRRPPRDLHVEAHLGGHHAAEEGGLDGVLPLVLRVAGAVVEPPDELDDVGVGARDLELGEGAPAELDDLTVEVLADGLDPAPGLLLLGRGPLDQLAEGAAGDLAGDAVAAVDAHLLAGLGELELDPRALLERAQEGAAVGRELLGEAGRQGDVGEQSLGEVVALVAVDRDAHDPAGLLRPLGIVGVLIDGADHLLRVGARVVHPAVDHLLPDRGGGRSGGALDLGAGL